MADDEQRPAVLAQEPHQPLLGVDVEVVGRLVEAQHVAAGEQDAGELDAPPLAARQHADRQIHAVVAEAEPGGDRPRPRSRPRSRRRRGTSPRPVCSGRRCARRVLLHRQPQLLDPLELVVDAAARQHVGDGGAALEDAVDARILRQVAEAALADDLPGRRLDGAAEHLEQAGLAGAVAADDADLVAGHDGEAGRLDDEPAADLHRETLRLEHRPGYGAPHAFQPR